MTKKQKSDADDFQDPYAALWPKFMADPEIAPPGSWSMKYHPEQGRYELIVHAHPGFNGDQAPIEYTPEIYRQNLARLFRRIANALKREFQSQGDVPSIEVLKNLLRRSI